ncbi:MAG: hypothetical protein Q9166_007915 [cf. Caloplaca sp. 2 TL-2023]
MAPLPPPLIPDASGAWGHQPNFLPEDPAALQACTPKPTASTSPPNVQHRPSNSSHKRQRAGRSDSTTGSSQLSSQRPPTTAFSIPTKRAIREDGENCWHCGATHALEHIHLIGRQRQNILDKLKALGKTIVEYLQQRENGMYLCGMCHNGLDDHEDLAWVFIPSNINFFIEAEETGYKSRTATANSTGVFPPRKPPSPLTYIQEHGGLYDVYMLRPHGPQNGPARGIWQRGRSKYQPDPKVWRGDPMLALYEGLRATTDNQHLFPSALGELDRLYELHDMGLPGATMDPLQLDGENEGDRPNPDGRGANQSTAPPTPEYSADGAVHGAGMGHGKSPMTRGGGNRGLGGKTNCGKDRVYKNVATQRLVELAQRQHEDWQCQQRKKSQLAATRIRVPKSPYKWGPDMSSKEQSDRFNKHRASMIGHGTSRPGRKRGAMKKKNRDVSGLPSSEACDESNERQPSGLGIDGVGEWLSNTIARRLRLDLNLYKKQKKNIALFRGDSQQPPESPPKAERQPHIRNEGYINHPDNAKFKDRAKKVTKSDLKSIVSKDNKQDLQANYLIYNGHYRHFGTKMSMIRVIPSANPECANSLTKEGVVATKNHLYGLYYLPHALMEGPNVPPNIAKDHFDKSSALATSIPDIIFGTI